MAYGDYNGPNKPDKGMENGSCNRTLCQASPAVWWNHGSHSWYCEDCRRDIEFDTLNYAHWHRDFYPRLNHPMFETTPMMNERKAMENAVAHTHIVLVDGVFPPIRCATGTEEAANACAEHIKKFFPSARPYVEVVAIGHRCVTETDPLGGHLKDGVNAFINTGNGDKRPEKGTLTICA